MAILKRYGGVRQFIEEIASFSFCVNVVYGGASWMLFVAMGAWARWLYL
jgi:hypothetical protein